MAHCEVSGSWGEGGLSRAAFARSGVRAAPYNYGKANRDAKLPDPVMTALMAYRSLSLWSGALGVCAIVATRELLYGLLRVFELLANQRFVAVRVFRSVPTAMAWLHEHRRIDRTRKAPLAASKYVRLKPDATYCPSCPCESLIPVLRPPSRRTARGGAGCPGGS